MTSTDANMSAIAQVVVPCSDLDASLAFFCDALDFRLDMIMPADRPRIAIVSGHGLVLRLEAGRGESVTGLPITLRLPRDTALRPAGSGDALAAHDGVRVLWIDANARVAIPDSTQAFTISRMTDSDAWDAGRAGMQYRDLIPGRMGGRFIASHIRIPDGGPVPDYVHYHHVRLQLIYCRRGWVRVVYEGQGEPFVMHAGDCVLQPPTIRHRVLEASPGLEVIEVGCPAEHETWRDHDVVLPTPPTRREHLFGGQRFVWHVAAEATWNPAHDARWDYRDTGIAGATDGLAGVRVLRHCPLPDGKHAAPQVHAGELLFLNVLDGTCRLSGNALGDHELRAGDACTIPAGADYCLDAATDCEILEVMLPARVG